MLIIGITGGSGSGKTSVVSKILSNFPQNRIAVLHMDCYYKDNSHLSVEQRAHLNFDHPDAIEFDLLYRQLQQLKDGKPVEQPVYDFITNGRKKETSHIEPAPVIIVEGILILTDKRLLDLFDIKIFVDAEPDDRLIRLIERDIKERGRNLQDVLERYELVKTMYQQFVEPTKRYADIIIPQGANNHVAIDMMVSIIRERLYQR